MCLNLSYYTLHICSVTCTGISRLPFSQIRRICFFAYYAFHLVSVVLGDWIRERKTFSLLLTHSFERTTCTIHSSICNSHKGSISTDDTYHLKKNVIHIISENYMIIVCIDGNIISIRDYLIQNKRSGWVISTISVHSLIHFGLFFFLVVYLLYSFIFLICSLLSFPNAITETEKKKKKCSCLCHSTLKHYLVCEPGISRMKIRKVQCLVPV